MPYFDLMQSFHLDRNKIKGCKTAGGKPSRSYMYIVRVPSMSQEIYGSRQNKYGTGVQQYGTFFIRKMLCYAMVIRPSLAYYCVS